MGNNNAIQVGGRKRDANVNGYRKRNPKEVSGVGAELSSSKMLAETKRSSS